MKTDKTKPRMTQAQKLARAARTIENKAVKDGFGPLQRARFDPPPGKAAAKSADKVVAYLISVPPPAKGKIWVPVEVGMEEVQACHGLMCGKWKRSVALEEMARHIARAWLMRE